MIVFDDSGYSHRVVYARPHPTFGEVMGHFRTTPDAVELHRATLAASLAAGEILEFRIEPLGEVAA